jgi:WD40 repeat protein
VWDTTNGRQAELRGHTDLITAWAISPDGRWLASASQEQAVIKIWDLPTVLEDNFVPGGPSLAFSPDGKRLATAGREDLESRISTVQVWDLGTRKQQLRLSGEGEDPQFSPDGTRLALGRTVWDATTGQVLLTLPGADGTFRAYSPDGRWMATTGNTRKIAIRDATTGEIDHVLRGTPVPRAVWPSMRMADTSPREDST